MCASLRGLWGQRGFRRAPVVVQGFEVGHQHTHILKVTSRVYWRFSGYGVHSVLKYRYCWTSPWLLKSSLPGVDDVENRLGRVCVCFDGPKPCTLNAMCLFVVAGLCFFDGAGRTSIGAFLVAGPGERVLTQVVHRHLVGSYRNY